FLFGCRSTSEEHGTASSFSDRFYDRPAAASRLAAPPSVAAAPAAPSSAAPAAHHHDGTARAPRLPRAAPFLRNGPYASSTTPPPPPAGAAAATAGTVSGGRAGAGTVGAGAASGSAGAAAAATTATGTVGGGWGYESSSSSRYNSTSSNSQADTGYSTTPSETNERRNSDQSSKKKTKSRSGSRSPSPSGSTISRSPSRSRSRSSSTSSTSTTSRDTASSTAGSPKSTRRPAPSVAHAHANHHHQPVVHSDDRRPLAICVRNLPVRSSDSSLKDGLFHEYKKHGKVTWVKVVGKDAERHAIVCFKKPEDVEKALEVSYDKLFFGCKIEVAPYQGYDVDDNDQRPYEAEIDEYHPKATRTLFIGNLEKDVTASELRKHFDQFGEIIEIDIKKQGAVSSYAFCQYTDIASVVKAIRQMDGEHLGNNRIKLGFGKSMPYAIVWLDGIDDNVTEKYLKMQFETFGAVARVYIDREKAQGLVVFEQLVSAQASVGKMRGFTLKGSKMQVDFASRECTEAFFERLERQGGMVDRSIFEERGIGTRGFEASNVSRFSSRYCDFTATARARTSSYSSRSSLTPSSCPASLQSPSAASAAAQGSLTPRGGSRSRRFAEFYDAAGTGGVEYEGRHAHSRGYDEYSQGSAASHDDGYEHEYEFVRDVSSPIHLDPLADPAAPFAPPDMRHLQKERHHLLEQLEECPSSGDELISPKKRLKLDLLDGGLVGEVVIEANRDHRKVMEVRRLSDVSLKHHSSRRPSIDSGKQHHAYLPHSVCKRRKTAGSDGGRPPAYDHRSGSESAGGSRPGTPLCDERPEHFGPSEPRCRASGREREGPLSLPLPRFAAQLINRGVVSVAGIKGQKDPLASPPPAVTSPRIVSNPRPPSPSPTPAPPPASPPPRPASLSPCSSDSGDAPAAPRARPEGRTAALAAPAGGPSLEERIRSLDERYERWSGSRAGSVAAGDALALLDASLEKFRQRHKILDLDLKEVQPSEIVKSVMAKRSVFDEDLKRLETVGEKYEPREFAPFAKTSLGAPTPSLSPVTTPLTVPPAVKVPPAIVQAPKTPTVLSPRSSGTSIPAAKGLQYPFPTHPPILMSPVPPHPQTPPAVPAGTTTAPPSTPTTATISTTASRSSAPHGDNRLKSCVSEPKNSSKINVNKNTVVSSMKSSDKVNVSSASEKIPCRRDSNSNSPRADVKTRRNSDTSARRIDDGESSAPKERAQSEERKKERFEKIKQENEKLEREKSERERIEKERLENERLEKIRIEKERLEKERLERESELEKQRLEKERLEKERLEKERQEREHAEKEKARLDKERADRECLEKAQKEKERLEKEKQELERSQKEKLEKEKERLDKERKEAEEKERREREDQQEKDKQERERKEREQKERDEIARRERDEKEKREQEERDRKEKESQQKIEREETEMLQQEKPERQEWERKREEDRTRHKDDNQDRRKDDHKHRETHSDSKHRDNNVDKHLIDNRNTKETGSSSTRDASMESRSSHHDKSKSHMDRDIDRRKESVKENRDNNVHDKHKSISESSNKSFVESRHMSIDFDKSKSHDKSDSSKRKERNNSLPASIGSKRRLSSHEISETIEDNKKTKLCYEHKKLSERRDSKDSNRSEERVKSSKHKNNVIKSHEKHISSRDSEEKRKEKEERHRKHKLEKQKSKSKSREKDSHESTSTPKSPLTDKDFLNRLDLRPNEDIEKHQKEKESREKRKNNSSEDHDRTKKDRQPTEKEHISEKLSKSRFESTETNFKTGEEKKKRERIRKFTNSSDTDSDEPKKHSIFDIVDDEPAYISMYDKVKARSCKNMAKLEEEKRQGKLKAKFTQLKQSRAKREEKKRSTSWDEDSDYDKDPSEMKIKKSSKMLIDSTDDESLDRKSRKKKETYSDSDCSGILKHVKQEPLDTSDDESKIKCMMIKGLKSRITSDTSEDEYKKKKLQVKSEIFSDVDNSQMFVDNEEKRHAASMKDELERLIKKERRNSKHQDSLTEVNAQLFNNTDPLEIKTEKYTHDNTSDEEAHEIAKKERSERREKKHKKKQKKQKHSISSEESGKADSVLDLASPENLDKDKTKHEKKKEHSRKEKRRDKTREGRDKPKKSKKNKSESKSEGKREGKMENIFGSLSEDSENGAKDVDREQKPNISVDDDGQNQMAYHSDSDKEHEQKTKDKSEKDREREEHHRKRKEKKRREKERRLQEAAAASSAVTSVDEPNENSMDYADMGKQLEANMMQDEILDVSQETNKEADISNFENPSDPFSVTETVDEPDHKKEKEERREGKEKKKKRKKSKDEKSKHHHHEKHHHHDKNKNKCSEDKIKKDISTTEEIKVEPSEPLPPPTPPQNPSLPTILDETSPVDKSALTPDYSISPMNPIISPIPSTPTTSKEKKREKFLPVFGTELDEKIHESAVKSISEISEFEIAVKKEDATNDEDCLSEKSVSLPEEKPRVIISQEETEDAVAALLGESFGGVKQEEFYSDDGAVNETPEPLVEESNVQDDEEMRQAVQSLSATDLDVKPDTPQSEHELQIDTDTEEQDDTPVKFDQPSKTPEKAAPALVPKTPDITSYFRRNEEPSALSPLVLKNPPNIGSPPSLTPIRPQTVKLVEVRKPLELEQNSLPLLPDQTQRTVITQSWTAEKKQDTPVPVIQPTVIKIETKKVPVQSLVEMQHLNKPISTPSARPYVTPILKITEQQYPPLKPLSKPDQLSVSPVLDPNSKQHALPISQASAKSPNAPPQMHNLPARSPVQINKPAVSEQGLLSPKLPPTLIHNRLPITPVLASKPMQPTTVKLPQSKVVNSLEPPKLVPASDHRLQERPRMVYQNAPQFTSFPANQPRMVIQGHIRHLPPQGLLVPTRQLTPQNFGYLGNIPHSNYGISPIIKENVTENVTERNSSDVTLPHNTGVVVSTASSLAPSRVMLNVPQHLSIQPLIIPKETSGLPPTPAMGSPKQPLNSPTPKHPFSPNSRHQLNSPSPKPVPPLCHSPNFSTASPNSPKSISQAPSPRLVSSPQTVSSPRLVSSPQTVSSPRPGPVSPITKSATDLLATCSQIEAPVQPSIIQAIPKLEIPTSLMQPSKTPEPQLVVAPELKTSIPSPVIVPVLKDVTEVHKSETSPRVEEQPVKLAIEMLTDELNMALGKSSPDIKDDKPTNVNPEEKSEKENPADKTDIVENMDELESLDTKLVDTKLTDNKVVDTKMVDIKPLDTEQKSHIEKDAITIIKDIEKFDEEKADTESVVSDISKERPGSADILAKEDPLDTKEDSDYWSAKEVNIDSVIKTLCSADELSDHSSEIGKDEWFDDHKNDETTKPEIILNDLTPEKKEQPLVASKTEESENQIKADVEPEEVEEPKEQISPIRASSRNRGARGGRGRGKARGGSVDRGGIQTRRGKISKELAVAIPPPNKRGRGARGRNERKSVKSDSEVTPTDIYEFRDESDEANKERPRLILTIKSPAVSNSNNALTTAIVKEVTKDGAKEIGKEHIKDTPTKSVEPKEEFTTPIIATNTRKSRRLQEKDTKNTVDDTIEDVVKNTVQTRSSSNQRRSTRQTVPKPTAVQSETPRKSPRGRKLRRGSEATENSSSEETAKEDIKPSSPAIKEIKVSEKNKEIEKPVEAVHPEEATITEPAKDKPFEGLKAAMLRRIKGELSSMNPEEPTNLIDPVTGELIPMRESEEGKYVPLPGDSKRVDPVTKDTSPPPIVKEIPKPQPTVIAQPQQVTVVHPPKPQSLKAHVLSSQAAQAIVSHQQPPLQTKPTVVVPTQPQMVVVSKPGIPPLVISKTIPAVSVPKTVTPIMINKAVTSIVASKISAPVVITKPVTPINQHLTVNTNLSVVSSTSSSPRPLVVSTMSSKSMPKQLVKPPAMLQKQHLQASKQQQQQLAAKGHLVSPMVSQAQMVNTQLAHVKHQPLMKQQVIMGAKGLHQQQILSGAPLNKSQPPMGSHALRVIQGLPPKVMEAPKIEVTMASVMIGQRPKLSPQGVQQRLLAQTGVPIPGYEASLLAERSLLNRSRSPPPAHQNSPSPKGEAIAHFPPGPLRQPPDINPAHYMHPSHVLQYQQYLRQQQYLTRSGGMEKVKDGQEGEEAPVTSPPLELRRPGSAGHALTGRGAAVPHSLHSPHDRATDSPQVGQVYNVHASRLPPYHPGRYYEPSEPPPAHRPLTSHASLAALGSDRGLPAHLSPMGGGLPDRPPHAIERSGGLPDRPPLSIERSGGLPDRPPMSIERSGGMLGAAGNLMGAVARHVGADAPTTQRGLQAATPPHASQVPPQAESLLMLLKQYPCMWQGLLALKNDQAAVQMYFVSGNDDVAKCSLPKNTDGSTPPLRIFQRMRLEPPQVEGVARKMQMENEHCMLLALPCGHDHMDVLKQSTNLTGGFITYLQQKQAAGIVNVAAPGTTQPPAYVVHIFPSCDFVNENLRRIAPSLLERVADIAHLLIVITTV
ncbi:unnamed protein product, partial [Phaedon cochleariae]